MHTNLETLSPKQRDEILSHLLAEKGLQISNCTPVPCAPAGQWMVNEASIILLDNLNFGKIANEVLATAAHLEVEIEYLITSLRGSFDPHVTHAVADCLFYELEKSLNLISDQILGMSRNRLNDGPLERVSDDIKRLIASDTFQDMKHGIVDQLPQMLFDCLSWSIDQNTLKSAISSALEKGIKEKLLLQIATDVCAAEGERSTNS